MFMLIWMKLRSCAHCCGSLGGLAYGLRLVRALPEPQYRLSLGLDPRPRRDTLATEACLSSSSSPAGKSNLEAIVTASVIFMSMVSRYKAMALLRVQSRLSTTTIVSTVYIQTTVSKIGAPSHHILLLVAYYILLLFYRNFSPAIKCLPNSSSPWQASFLSLRLCPTRLASALKP